MNTNKSICVSVYWRELLLRSNDSKKVFSTKRFNDNNLSEMLVCESRRRRIISEVRVEIMIGVIFDGMISRKYRDK